MPYGACGHSGQGFWYGTNWEYSGTGAGKRCGNRRRECDPPVTRAEPIEETHYVLLIEEGQRGLDRADRTRRIDRAFACQAISRTTPGSSVWRYIVTRQLVMGSGCSPWPTSS